MTLAVAGAMALAVAFPAAAQPAEDQYDNDSGGSLTGSITSISDDGVLVEENPGESGASEKGNFVVSDETEVLIREDGEIVSADESDLEVGQLVEVAYSGPVQESYPFTASADQIVILEGDSGGEDPKDPGNGDHRDDDPGNGGDQYDGSGGGQYDDPGNSGGQYDDSADGGGSAGDSGEEGEASGISVLPDTGGAALLTLGIGALLVAGGLLARRILG